MIRIVKYDPPSDLVSKGARELQTITPFTPQELDDYEFKAAIYGSPEVKQALREAQHDKCAFCEAKLSHVAYGDVEHFRPKAGIYNPMTGKLEKPGYFWLAYDWSNLYLSCQICNQKYKKNHFPVGGTRAVEPSDDLSAEHPLIIDPGAEDPERFIEFVGPSPHPIAGNPRGRETILRTGLDREILEERRRDALGIYNDFLQVYEAYVATEAKNGLSDVAKGVLSQLKARILSSVDASHEFSSMFRCLLRDWNGKSSYPLPF